MQVLILGTYFINISEFLFEELNIVIFMIMTYV